LKIIGATKIRRTKEVFSLKQQLSKTAIFLDNKTNHAQRYGEQRKSLASNRYAWEENQRRIKP